MASLSRGMKFIVYAVALAVFILLFWRVLGRPYDMIFMAFLCYLSAGLLAVPFIKPEGAFSRRLLGFEAKDRVSESRWLRLRRGWLWIASGYFLIALIDSVLALRALGFVGLNEGWADMIHDTSGLCFFLTSLAVATKKWREA